MTSRFYEKLHLKTLGLKGKHDRRVSLSSVPDLIQRCKREPASHTSVLISTRAVWHDHPPHSSHTNEQQQQCDKGRHKILTSGLTCTHVFPHTYKYIQCESAHAHAHTCLLSPEIVVTHNRRTSREHGVGRRGHHRSTALKTR